MKDDPEFKSSLLKKAWSLMPEGIRQTVTSEPIIPAIAARAKAIAASNPNLNTGSSEPRCSPSPPAPTRERPLQAWKLWTLLVSLALFPLVSILRVERQLWLTFSAFNFRFPVGAHPAS